MANPNQIKFADVIVLDGFYITKAATTLAEKFMMSLKSTNAGGTSFVAAELQTGTGDNLNIAQYDTNYAAAGYGGFAALGQNTTGWAIVAYGTNGIIRFLTGGADMTANLRLEIDQAGRIKIKSGADQPIGTAVLVGGTITVNNILVTANSIIMLTVQQLGTVAVPTAIAITAKVAATSFTITSANALDTSTIAWEIIEQM